MNLGRLFFLILLSLTFSGCGYFRPSPPAAGFDWITPIPLEDSGTSSSLVGLPLSPSGAVDASVVGMPMKAFAVLFASKTGLGLSYSSTLEDSSVTAEFRGSDPSDMISIISRSLGVAYSRVGSTFYIGPENPEDKLVLVRRVYSQDVQGLNQILTTLGSGTGSSFVDSRGVVVVMDYPSSLVKIDRALQEFEQSESGLWVVQLQFLDDRSGKTSSYGIDVNAGSVGILEGAASSDLTLSWTHSLTGFFSYVLRLGRQVDTRRVLSSPLFLMTPGVLSRVHDGSRLPLVELQIDSETRVEREVVRYEQVGFILELTLLEVSSTRAQLDCTVEISQVSGFAEGKPIIQTRKHEIHSVLESGSPALVGRLLSSSRYQARDGIFSSLWTDESIDSSIEVLARVDRLR